MRLQEASIFTDEKVAARSRLLVALAISLAFHLTLVLNGQFRPGLRNSPGLQVTLLPAAVKEAAPAEVPAPGAEISMPIRPAKASRPAEPRKVPRKPQPPDLAASAPVPAPPAVTPGRGAELKEQSVGIPLPGMSGRVSRAAISFDVFSGADRQRIGSGQHLYVADRDDNFGISIKEASDGTGEKSPWHIEISGKIGNRGLAPFLYESLGSLAQRLLTIRSSADKEGAPTAANKKWRMPDGIIDRQSLLYYFMFKPPELTGGKVLLSDGVSYAPFSYRIAGTESFPIAGLGEVHSVKLTFTTADSNETIELWVAPILHHLPVKVRYVDKQGVITEQTATAIDFVE
jgi:hypothetical protein